MSSIRFYSLSLISLSLAFAAEIAQISFSGLSYTPLTSLRYPQQGWRASFDFSIEQTVSTGDYFQLSMAHVYRLKFDNDDSTMSADLNDGTEAFQCYVTQQAAYLYEDTVFRCEAIKDLSSSISGSISFSLSFSNGGSTYTYELQNANVFHGGANEVQLGDSMSASITFDGYNFTDDIYTIGRTTTYDNFESYYLAMKCDDGYLIGGTQTINYDRLNKNLTLDCESAQVFLSDNFNDWSLPVTYESAKADITCSSNTIKVSLNETEPQKMLWINALQKVAQGVNTIQHDVNLAYSCSNTLQKTIYSTAVHTIVEYTIYQGTAAATVSQSSSTQGTTITKSCSECTAKSSDETSYTSYACSKCSSSSFSNNAGTSSESCFSNTEGNSVSTTKATGSTDSCTICHHSGVTSSASTATAVSSTAVSSTAVSSTAVSSTAVSSTAVSSTAVSSTAVSSTASSSTASSSTASSSTASSSPASSSTASSSTASSSTASSSPASSSTASSSTSRTSSPAPPNLSSTRITSSGSRTSSFTSQTLSSTTSAMSSSSRTSPNSTSGGIFLTTPSYSLLSSTSLTNTLVSTFSPSGSKSSISFASSSSILPSYVSSNSEALSQRTASSNTLPMPLTESSCSTLLKSTCSASAVYLPRTSNSTTESASCSQCQIITSSDSSDQNTWSAFATCDTCMSVSKFQETRSSHSSKCSNCPESVKTQTPGSWTVTYISERTTYSTTNNPSTLSEAGVIVVSSPESATIVLLTNNTPMTPPLTDGSTTEGFTTTIGATPTDSVFSMSSIRPLSLQPTPLESYSSQSLAETSQPSVYEGSAFTNGEGKVSRALIVMLLLAFL